MPDQPARRFSRAEANACAWDQWHAGLVRLGIGIDDPQRLVAGIDRLHGANLNAAIGIGAGRAQTCFTRRLLRERREAIEIEIVAGQRPNQIRACAAPPRMESRRMLDMDFSKFSS